MVLPPLELFSLRRELPCCRAALSVLWACFELRIGRSLFLIGSCGVRGSYGLSPPVSAGLASPRIDRGDAFEHRISRAAFRTRRRLELRRIQLRFFDDLFGDRSRGDLDCGLKLVGCDQDDVQTQVLSNIDLVIASELPETDFLARVTSFFDQRS